MTKKKAIPLTFLVLLSLFLFSACENAVNVSGYTIVDSTYSTQYDISFRSGDKLHDQVNAAIKVLAADGTVDRLAMQWFGENSVSFESDALALDELEQEISPRTFIIGVNENSAPMSFKDSSGQYAGFDVELARAVCSLLGWELRVQPIAAENVATELKSGNIDCGWGGICLDEGDEALLSVIPAYLANEYVFAVRQDSGLAKLNRIEGQTLAYCDSSLTSVSLESYQTLADGIELIIELDVTSECFESLDSGKCDVILVRSLDADYYLTH